MKKSIPPKKRRSQAGFTLLEILVVVTILGIIVGIVGVAVTDQLEEAKSDTGRIQMETIAKSLDVYKVKYHKYPTTAEGLNAMTSPPKGGKPIMQSIPPDPWDQDWVYVSPGQHNRGSFDIQSKGPDGAADTEDDLKNWK